MQYFLITGLLLGLIGCSTSSQVFDYHQARDTRRMIYIPFQKHDDLAQFVVKHYVPELPTGVEEAQLSVLKLPQDQWSVSFRSVSVLPSYSCEFHFDNEGNMISDSDYVKPCGWNK